MILYKKRKNKIEKFFAKNCYLNTWKSERFQVHFDDKKGNNSPSFTLQKIFLLRNKNL